MGQNELQSGLNRWGNVTSASARIMRKLKPAFLDAFAISAGGGWPQRSVRRLSEFLIVDTLAPRKYRSVQRAEARRALQRSNDDGRAAALWQLATMIEKDSDWKQLGAPFFRDVWPKEEGFQTAETTQRMIHLVERSGDNFPDAVKLVLSFVRPLDRLSFLALRSQKEGDSESPAARFPNETLALLDRGISDHPALPPYDLAKTLDLIVDAAPELRQDLRWIRLNELIRPR